MARMSLWLSLLMVAGAAMAEEAAPPAPPTDVAPNHWASESIQTIRQLGVMDVNRDGSFKGERTITRYELAKALVSFLTALKDHPGMRGPAGEAGKDGAQGPKGEVGPQGERGLPPGDAEVAQVVEQVLTRKLVPLWVVLGKLADDPKDRETCFAEATKGDPSNVEAIVWHGAALLDQGNGAGAAAAAGRALELNDKYAPAYDLRGRCLRAEGKTAEAIESFKRAVAMDANYVPAYLSLGLCFEQAQDKAAAQKCYEKALELKPKGALRDYAQKRLDALK